MSKRTQKPNYKLRRGAAILLAAGLLGALLLLGIPRHPARSESGQLLGEEKTLTLGGLTVDKDPAVAPSALDLACFSSADGRLRYDDGRTEGILGIDVSGHQGDIDWRAVAADGVRFAFVRIGARGTTEGRLYADSMFERNFTGAAAAGIGVGAYFFSQATSVEEALEEAAFVLEALDGRPCSWPVAFDWEYVSEESRTAEVAPETVSACCVAFCEEIKKAGYTPLVYFNRYTAYVCYDLAAVDGYGFWAAEYTDAPTFYYRYDILQYSSSGRVAGIAEDVDLNLAFVDYAG